MRKLSKGHYMEETKERLKLEDIKGQHISTIHTLVGETHSDLVKWNKYDDNDSARSGIIHTIR